MGLFRNSGKMVHPLNMRDDSDLLVGVKSQHPIQWFRGVLWLGEVWGCVRISKLWARGDVFYVSYELDWKMFHSDV